jgi:hypothetical protein
LVPHENSFADTRTHLEVFGSTLFLFGSQLFLALSIFYHDCQLTLLETSGLNILQHEYFISTLIIVTIRSPMKII